MFTRINSEGKRESLSSPFSQGYEFHPCQVEVDECYSIRQIYDRWKKGKPTSVHPFDCEFDDDADDIDFEHEMPIDRCQIENEVENLRDVVNSEKEEKRRKKKEKDDYRRERDEFVDSLVKKLPHKE